MLYDYGRIALLIPLDDRGWVNVLYVNSDVQRSVRDFLVESLCY